MSSFFTLPASQRKRKRTQPATKSDSAAKRRRSGDEDSISGSDLSDGDVGGRQVDDEGSDDEDEEFQDEDPAAKRIRLAERYLANTQKEVLEEDGGFDAAEIDQENLRRRMGGRLKEDTAESKGKLYRWIAEDFDWRGGRAKSLPFTGAGKSFTAVAIHGNIVYAASKDLHILKWDLGHGRVKTPGERPGNKAKIVKRTRGDRKAKHGQHHSGSILCAAVSPDGRLLATGGSDRKLIIWDAESLKPLKVFTQHRDSVTALAFRRGTQQLFSASKDRTVKIWSLSELAYVETLFGHQDEVVDVSALAQEKCATVGARDRTARLWKVVEESQLVFRGGGAPGKSKAVQALKEAYGEDSGIDLSDDGAYNEGSIDRVAMIDDDTFVTGSDNGSLSLWNIHKKKPVFTLALAHGLDPPLPLEQASAEQDPDEDLDARSRGGKQSRWITALKAIPFSNVLVSGSWDGYVRGWKISQDKRRIESLGAIGAAGENVDALLDQAGLHSDALSNDALQAIRAGTEKQRAIRGLINDLTIVDRGDRGKEGVLIAAAVGKEHRLGRWREMSEGQNRVLIFEVPRRVTANGESTQSEEEVHDGPLEEEADFEGFD